ncbi:hypothetical protein [Pseudomonas sp. AL03]|uniref:hypothetical protein n=1 Tax=Pseudomonas sp. AL03 TaxID=3042230 RepID=UPI00249A7D44|nr:hypothetical protein [Pseudomonas sp. AL03]MDI3271145.1 hypothetical protein [Pseudomonas sp. AL03]
MQKCLWFLGLLAALSAPSAQAASQEIQALFQPDPAQPNKNVFINKTPNTGYCALYPAQCTDNGMFSIQIPVRFNSQRAMNPGEVLQLRAPANWRKLTVTNAQTLETETVEVRIIGLGSQYVLSHPAAELTGETSALKGHEQLWREGLWVNASPPCQYSGVGSYTADRFRFFWKTPQEESCTKTTQFHIPSISFDTMDIAYELRTPNPLGMSTGLYTGSLTYTLGPQRDFTFGPLMFADDNVLTLDFVLDVQHTLKVDVPPGGNKVSLEPEGGWQQWIDGGRKPDRIFREQIFYISASSRFKVMMVCDDSNARDHCRMYGGGNVTKVTTDMTLPAGITSNGNPVSRFRLLHNVWSEPFQPSQYVDRQVGTLLFEIPRESIEQLLQPGTSASLSTAITIIWDSEV